MRFDPFTLVLVAAALVLVAIAYLKDPGMPLIGARNGLSFLWFVLPRLIPALIIAGLIQVRCSGCNASSRGRPRSWAGSS